MSRVGTMMVIHSDSMVMRLSFVAVVWLVGVRCWGFVGVWRWVTGDSLVGCWMMNDNKLTIKFFWSKKLRGKKNLESFLSRSCTGFGGWCLMRVFSSSSVLAVIFLYLASLSSFAEICALMIGDLWAHGRRRGFYYYQMNFVGIVFSSSVGPGTRSTQPVNGLLHRSLKKRQSSVHYPICENRYSHDYDNLSHWYGSRSPFQDSDVPTFRSARAIWPVKEKQDGLPGEWIEGRVDSFWGEDVILLIIERTCVTFDSQFDWTLQHSSCSSSSHMDKGWFSSTWPACSQSKNKLVKEVQKIGEHEREKSLYSSEPKHNHTTKHPFFFIGTTDDDPAWIRAEYRNHSVEPSVPPPVPPVGTSLSPPTTNSSPTGRQKSNFSGTDHSPVDYALSLHIQRLSPEAIPGAGCLHHDGPSHTRWSHTPHHTHN